MEEDAWGFIEEEVTMERTGNLYWDGFREFNLIRVKFQRLINKYRYKMLIMNTHGSEYKEMRKMCEGWREKLESMKIDKKILEDGIEEYYIEGKVEIYQFV